MMKYYLLINQTGWNSTSFLEGYIYREDYKGRGNNTISILHKMYPKDWIETEITLNNFCKVSPKISIDEFLQLKGITVQKIKFL